MSRINSIEERLVAMQERLDKKMPLAINTLEKYAKKGMMPNKLLLESLQTIIMDAIVKELLKDCQECKGPEQFSEKS